MQRRRISSFISAAVTNLVSAVSTRYASAFIVCLLLCLGTTPSLAQNKQKKIVEQQVDTIPFFRGMTVSVDAVGAAQILLGDYGQYEAALRVNLKDKYYPIIELGLGKADAKDDGTNIRYKTSAPYGRIGMDWNLLKNKHDIYRLFGGIRYAFTSFKYDIEGPDITDPIWGTTAPYSAKGISCNYHWVEAAFGVDVKIWGPVRMGWSVRYKRRIAYKKNDIGNTWYVPGYGKQGGSRLGGTFNIGIEI